ncbi:stage II sporulation protein R [Paenibacillus sp. CMAA1364]
MQWRSMNLNETIEDELRIFVKNVAIIFSIFFMFAMTWDGQRIDASIAGGPIPEESIRLRILANSDSVSDQLLKREIRDAIVGEMNRWVVELDNPQSLDQARATISNHMDDLNRLVGKELYDRGIRYSYNVELSVVPFPTKMYGDTVYPAGEYEALRVTLGQGRGQNWWCVLFPPLCFIDSGSGDARVQNADDSVRLSDGSVVDNLNVKQVSAVVDPEPEVRFFLWDLLHSIMDWVKGLF